MPILPHRIRFLIAFFGITALSWIDYQYFSEGGAVKAIDDHFRALAHLAILILLVPIGWFGWSLHGIAWLRQFWLFSYIAAIVFFLIFGVVQSYVHAFGTSMRDSVAHIRIFFTSPMPFLLLQLARMLLKEGHIPTDTTQ